MSRRTDTESVNDILEAAQRVMTYVSGMSYEGVFDTLGVKPPPRSYALPTPRPNRV